MDEATGKAAVILTAPDLIARPARSLAVNVALMRAFRRSPMDFLDVLVASGAGTVPLRMGPERVLLVDDATQVWELLTTHARRTGRAAGWYARDYCSATACSPAKVRSICGTAAPCSRRSTRSESPTTWRTSPAPRGARPTGGPTVATSTSSQRCRP